MSKRRKHKQNKKKSQKRSSSFSNLNISGISQHARQGSKLSPPLAQIPMMRTSSWADDHMPEMLWAVLLAETFERRDYLGCFRDIAILSEEWFRRDEADQESGPQGLDSETGPNFTVVVDHTTLSEITDAQFHKFISILLRHPLGYAALRPLLLIESLPGRERWIRELGVEPTNEDWQTLAHAVAGVLDHQSEESTDIRWFKLMVPIIAGRMFFHSSMAERVEELRLFPNKGDMRSVRPFVRSGEMTLRRSPHSLWVEAFWKQSLEKTGCIDPTQAGEYSVARTRIDSKTFYAARHDVIERFFNHMSARRVDARLDSSFGLILYALSMVEEVGFHHLHTRIIGRVALRALVEANITLRYLINRNADELWRSYRVYGAGQAKLAFLKAQEAEGELPPFIDERALHEIANEDKWQEYLDIDIGHWADSTLRKLAIDCGAKDVYDKYYDWTSGFAHGHWGAVRDTNFVTCHNALHRLHRIPRLSHRRLNSVETDAVELVNDMIQRIDQLFPGESSLGEITLLAPEQQSPGSESREASQPSAADTHG